MMVYFVIVFGFWLLVVSDLHGKAREREALWVKLVAKRLFKSYREMRISQTLGVNVSVGFM